MKPTLAAVCAVLALAGATTAQSTEKGVVGGAAAGAVGGALVAGPAGAVVGGVGGAIVGNHVTNHPHNGRKVRHYRKHHPTHADKARNDR